MVTKIILGDCRTVLKTIKDNSINVCITSPPYWGCRDYGTDGQIGIEQNPFDYIEELLNIFSIIKNKLTVDGNLFIIIDDIWISNWTRCRKNTWISSKEEKQGMSSETKEMREKSKIQRNWAKDIEKKPGMEWFKAKQKMMLPERLIIRMQEEQLWFFREKLIWYKPNVGNYTNVHDRFAHAYEYILHLTKSQYYFTNMNAIIDEKTRKLQRDVLEIPIEKTDNIHTATFPLALVETLINFTCPQNGIVLDPFCGIGTTLIAAEKLGQSAIGIELSLEYYKLAQEGVSKIQESLKRKQTKLF